MGSGIYKITNQANGKCYIGSSVNCRQRWLQHLSDLRHGRHHNQHLQRAFDKYGEAVFVFSILERAEAESLINQEQHFLGVLSPEYNIAPIAGSPMLSRHHTLESRQKMSEAKQGERNPLYGKQHSKKTRLRMSATHKGKSISAETRQKISEALSGERHPQYGRPVSKETRQKLSEAWTPELRKAQSKRMAALDGEKHPNYGKHPSIETRVKMSESQKGHLVSTETRAKISSAERGERNHMYGKHHSEETRRKMSESQKAYWHKVHASKKLIVEGEEI